jgi:hypothetical protein
MSATSNKDTQNQEYSPRVAGQRFAYASFHARKRIAQRTSLDILKLMSYLDAEVCINIGYHAGMHRRHLLFYSAPDDTCFVAIQDPRYGKVVTVLPLEYHRRLAWAVSEEQCELAKQRYYAYIEAQEALQRLKSEKEYATAPKVKLNAKEQSLSIKYRSVTTTERTYKVLVQAIYISEDASSKKKSLFRILVGYYIDDFQKSIKSQLNDPTLYEKIDASIQKKSLFQGSVYALCFQNSKDKSDFYLITLRHRNDAEWLTQHHYKQRRHMQRVLACYQTTYLALPAPPVETLPQVS